MKSPANVSRRHVVAGGFALSPILHVGDDRGRLLVQRTLEGNRQFGVMLMGRREDSALGHLAR